jgi:hypothetical protein
MSAVSEREIDLAILRAGSVDYLDYWFISRLVGDLARSPEAGDPGALTIQAVGRLLVSGQLRAGDLEPPGEFVAWPLSPEAAFERVRSRVDELSDELMVGDIAWFEVPTASST